MVEDAIDILNGEGDIVDFGKLLHESWRLKTLSDKVSTSHIDDIYETALKMALSAVSSWALVGVVLYCSL